MKKRYKPKKYLIVDFGASLIHTHHAQSIYSFFDLIQAQGVPPEIWVPLGSNLKSEFYPIKYKLLPGTHSCEFKLFSAKTWISGTLGKIQSMAIKYDLEFLLKLIVNFSSFHLCYIISRLNKSYELSIKLKNHK